MQDLAWHQTLLDSPYSPTLCTNLKHRKPLSYCSSNARGSKRHTQRTPATQGRPRPPYGAQFNDHHATYRNAMWIPTRLPYTRCPVCFMYMFIPDGKRVGREKSWTPRPMSCLCVWSGLVFNSICQYKQSVMVVSVFLANGKGESPKCISESIASQSTEDYHL